MSSTKRDRSPSVEVTDPNTADSKISVEDEFTEIEEEFMSGNDKTKACRKMFHGCE